MRAVQNKMTLLLVLFSCFIITSGFIPSPRSRKTLSSSPYTITSRATSVEAEDQCLVSEEDKVAIFEQLGYIPSNLVSVSARRGTGSPLALKTYSLNGGASRRKAKAQGDMTPFPTLYWHCCQVVGKAIGELEREGYVRILEQRLVDDPEALNQFIQSHEGYANERWMALTEEHQEYLQKSARMTNMVKYSGIAGTDFKSFAPNVDDPNHAAEKPSIKCLHAHYAHYRSQIENVDGCDYPLNIIGEWIHEILQQRNDGLIL